MRASLGPNACLEYDVSGDGPVVVLLHAFPLCRAMWEPQVQALSPHYRAVTPDFRGFGGSSPFESAPSVDTLADDVATLLDDLGVATPVVVGGLSMGGYVALAFARRHPARLRGLVLADTKAEPDSSEARANRDRTIAFAREHTAAEVAEQMLPKLLGEQTRARRPEVAEEVRRIARAQSTEGIIGALQALRDRPDATPGLGRIGVPTLVLVGSEDVLTPPSQAQALAAALRQARLTVINGAGHLANLEHPAAFNAALRAFLNSLP